MKKTMFITSIVMVVVLAVALTTSSLAWFSAAGATTVKITQMTLQAEGRVATSGLEISNDGNTWSTEKINFQHATEDTVLVDPDGDGPQQASPVGQGTYTYDNELKPLCPVGTIGVVDDNDEQTTDPYVDADFFVAVNHMATNEIYHKNGTTWTFQNDPTTIGMTPFIDEFSLRNSGEKRGQVSITIEAWSVENNSYSPTLWVAIFDVTGVSFDANTYDVSDQSTAQPKLVALQGSKKGYTISNNQYSGGAASATMTYAADLEDMAAEEPISGLGALTISRFDLKPVILEAANYNNGQYTAGAARNFLIYAWFDGTELSNTNSGESAKITVSFGITSLNN